jgi:hypothetical protein
MWYGSKMRLDKAFYFIFFIYEIGKVLF